MKNSVCVYENHIICDMCLADSADIHGVSQYSCDMKMKEIIQTCKQKGWYVKGDFVLCSECNTNFNINRKEVITCQKD